MRTIIDDLPADLAGALTDASPGEPTELRYSPEGEALRNIRAIIFREDPLRTFGGLRRAQDPTGDFLWVCKDHYLKYDPGLPALP